ncbi:hypothetical protein KBZ15_10085 [Cyanobium sp. BA20m-p-22]|uniref:hypothetical protein n=1 Tax=Cyanobium sp. BA20m-p-22 TaxID=2823704 RepID=UPI0020CFB5C5|nr:hypothetical protein [Cyanobium sp. BA20m-p-22]MCP9910252.1 hypothetical protein [Cyanobium sp. BA20m-p-22]
MNHLSQLQIITATDGAGTNCHHRAQAALAVFPQLRAVIGSLMIRGCRDLRTGRTVPWAKPWGHHVWLIEPDGGYYDPSAPNLMIWAEVQEIELPRPWEQLRAGVIESRREQSRIVAQIIGGHPTGADLPEALYLPGLIYSSDVEELPQSPAYVTAWGRLASESVKAGGWDAAQLDAGLARVEGLMDGPPQIKGFDVPRHRAKRPPCSAHGFAREVA